MELTNIHPAEAYLRNEQNPSFLYISKQTKFINTAKTYQSHRKDDYPNIGWYNVFHKVTHIFGANRCDYA